jgi:S-adenosylmethionine hydrolase
MRIALMTDFGTRDPYVAAMKGVIAGRTDAPIIDLTHEIAPFDAWEAAFFLRDAMPYWPGETIVAAVIDPGVGTARRMIAVASRGMTVFLAPDNGTLHFVGGAARSVENEALFLPHGSTTFHGRDRFAPVAAALANGLPFEELGPEVRDRVMLEYEPPSATRGTIVRIDRFGNAITDLVCGPASALRVGQHTIGRWSDTYSGDGAFLVKGSTGCVEISIAQASAASLLQLRRGERVEIV